MAVRAGPVGGEVFKRGACRDSGSLVPAFEIINIMADSTLILFHILLHFPPPFSAVLAAFGNSPSLD